MNEPTPYAANAASMTPDAFEYVRALDRARTIVRAANTLTIISALLLAFYPHPYQLVIALAVALPFLALALLFAAPKMFCLYGPGTEVRPKLALPFVLPGFALMLFAMMHSQLLHGEDGWKLAFAGAGLFAVLLFLATCRTGEHVGQLLLFSIFMGGYGYGAGALMDQAFDFALPSQVAHTKVLGKAVVTGFSRQPILLLASWGMTKATHKYPVSWEVFQAVQEGQDACVAVHQGLLGLPWYEVQKCR